MKKPTMFCCLILVTILFSGSSIAQDTETSPLESITMAEMRDHIYFLASDYLGGRVGPSPEYEIAAQYVASQFAAAGLKPMESEMENMHGYFQEVPFKKRIYADDIQWVVNSAGKKQVFRHLEDYKILEDEIIPEKPMEVVFIGYGIEEPDHGWNDLEELDLEDKMVVLLTGAPEKKGKPVLPEAIHQSYLSMRGLQKKAMPIFRKGPAAITIILDEGLAAMMPFDKIHSSFEKTGYTYQGYKEGAQEFTIPTVYVIKERVLEALFEGQAYNPLDIAETGLKKYRCYQLENLTVDTQFPVESETDVFLKNVIGMVKGTDPKLSKEIIVVGAHLDHVIDPRGDVNNGADDNASGSAGVMEIAEAVAMDPPLRSVVFVTYTAEEMGLYGSHYFVHWGPCSVNQMKFNINLDMIGRTAPENRESGGHYLVADKQYMVGIQPFVDNINSGSLKLPLVYDSELHIGSSDHASFSNAGIPAFFFFSGLHEDLHKPGDDPEKIEYDKAVNLSKLSYLITMKLANMDEVPGFTDEL